MAEPQVDEFDETSEDHEEATDTTTGNFEIDSDVEMGARQRNTLRNAKYPFDALQVGQSFHIPATTDAPQPGKTVAGAVTNANTKWSRPDPSGEVETKVVATYELDANGKRAKVNGAFVKTGEQTVTRVKRIQDRHFTIRSVGNVDQRGPGARVFRDL